MFLALDLTVLNALNYLIYLILIVTILFGFLRGGKKSIYILIMMIVFFVIFFLTIDSAANFLFTYEMPWLAEPLSGIDPSLANFTTIEGSMETFLEMGLDGQIDLTASSAEVMNLATQIVKFVIKLVWTVVYFSVFFILYRIVVWIVGLFVVKNKKGQSKQRLLGAIFGGLNGLVAVYILIVMAGGIHSITTSAVTLLEETTPPQVAQIHELSDEEIPFDSTTSVIPLADGDPIVDEEYIQYLRDFNESYSNNLFVKLASNIKTTSSVDENTEVETHIDLFDRVFSFEYNESVIALRYELTVFAAAGNVFLDSTYATTNELTDITGDEIRDMFSALSSSKLITSLVPVAIEIAADMNDITLDISQDDLYNIDYDQELGNIGSIAGAMFDILNGAGFIGGTGDLSQLTITGETVRDVFTDVSESDVILLLSDTLLVPMLEDPESNISTIITVPANLDMEAEYLALGSIAGEIIDAGISFSDLESGDVSVLLNSISQVDLNILKDSDLVSSALINIFSGTAQIEGLSDIIETPTGLVWEDDGVVDGELTKILTSLNVLTSVASNIDFENFDLTIVNDLTPSQIDTFFNSYVIRATISEFIKEMDLTGVPLVFPDSIYDDQNYFTESELTSVVEAVSLIVGDTAGEFDVIQALSLTETEIQTLLSSDIIYATVGDMIYGYGSDMLTIPDTVVTQVVVNALNHPVISKAEVTDILEALAVLDIQDFDTMSFDASIINTLENTTQDDLDQVKIDTLLDSEIIHATVSKMIVDLGTGTNDLLVIPDLDVTGNDLHTVVGTLDYISVSEIGNVLRALYAINITDFNTMNLEDTSLIINNIDKMLVSSIIQATISKQITDLDGSVLVIPEIDIEDEDVKIVQGTTTYIDADELEALIDVINLMGIANPTQVTSTVDLTLFATGTNQDVLLDSAIMHATVSDTLMSYGSGILVIPLLEEDDTPIQIEKGSSSNETTFIAKQELKDMLTALNAMGFLDINSFTGAMNTSAFLDNAALVLESACLQATISDIILNSDTVDSPTPTLLIPDEEVPGGTEIRIAKTDVTYISKAELTRFFASVNELGLSNFDTFTFEASDVFNLSDVDAFFNSFIMQAAASKYILDVSGDETAAAGTSVLLVPSTKLEDIEVDSTAYEHIEKTEIIHIFEVLGFLGMDNFNSTLPTNTIQNLTRDQIKDDVLISASFHLTIDNMLRANPTVGSAIPNIAKQNYYSLVGIDLTTPDEIADLVIALNKITSGGDFTSTSIDYASIYSLSQADRDDAIHSLTIRQFLTPTLVTLVNNNPMLTNYVQPDDYEATAPADPDILDYEAAKYGLDNN